MTAAYLWINAALYLVFAVMCVSNVTGTASALGYKTLSASGHSEYVTVYGGLQVGLAIFFAVAAYQPEWHRVGLLMALCLYAAIVIFRLASLVVNWPVQRMTLGVAALEVSLLLIAAGLWLAARR